MCRFKHGGDLGELWRLREVSEFIGGHGQISARSLENVVAVNTEEFFVEVAMKGPSLLIDLVISSGLGHRDGAFVITPLRAVGVLVFTGGAFLVCFTVPGGLSILTLKIAPPRKSRGGGCLVKVSARGSVDP